MIDVVSQSEAAERPVTVLLAEDEALVRWGLADEFRDAGWKVVEVATADDAIAFLQTGAIVDLILTDINMPGRANGLDLARFAAGTSPKTSIAIMSAIAPLDELGASSAGGLCDLFFQKPFHLPDVIPQLSLLLRATDKRAAIEPYA
jgi:CheY-like chemotaxis protein